MFFCASILHLFYLGPLDQFQHTAFAQDFVFDVTIANLNMTGNFSLPDRMDIIRVKERWINAGKDYSTTTEIFALGFLLLLYSGFPILFLFIFFKV